MPENQKIKLVWIVLEYVLRDVIILGRVLPDVERPHHADDIQHNCEAHNHSKQVDHIPDKLGQPLFAALSKPILLRTLTEQLDSIVPAAGGGRGVIREEVALTLVPTTL